MRQVDETNSEAPEVRPARIEDIPAMARVHVRSWQQTYRGLMSDEILDDPGFVSRRERLWTAALSDERYANYRVAVAEHCGKVVGIAMAGRLRLMTRLWTFTCTCCISLTLITARCGHRASRGRNRAGRECFPVGGRSKSACPSLLPQASLPARRHAQGRRWRPRDPHVPQLHGLGSSDQGAVIIDA